MTVSENIIQQPGPGSRFIAFRGDVFTFRLQQRGEAAGTAWLRTNIGRARRNRQETIQKVEADEAPMHQNWSDIRMEPTEDGFAVTVPLTEVGHFEAKAYFMPEEGGAPIWPRGENTVINVEPADTVCGNIIYNAFIRQFGPNKHSRQAPPKQVDFETLDQRGFTVIPPSGKFRDFIKELDFIVYELGCRYIQLMPIHPTPTTYGRMGRFGSPYAAQSFTAVDAAMAEFDPRATPLEQFMELVDAVHKRHARIILDIAINHTGWGATIHETHPHWLYRTEDGKIQVPGAWGVMWEDLTKLDYRYRDLWCYMADVFLTWCRRGVDGFRCDAGYMIPVEAWRYIVDRVREEFPETIFFLEGLGGKISVTREILDKSNFNWAYSELFQNYDRGQVTHHLPLVNDIAAKDGVMIHFAETHDNNRMAATSNAFARMRTALCALLSHEGGFAFANGVEWYATEKIDVHNSPSLNWGAEENQVKHLRRLNTLLKTHPAFFDRVEQRFVMAAEGNFIAVHRKPPGSATDVVIVVNLNHEKGVSARWTPPVLPIEGAYYVDLISGQRIDVRMTGEDVCGRDLEPGQVLCLSADIGDIENIKNAEKHRLAVPDRCAHQKLRAAALEVYHHYRGIGHIGDFDVDQAAVDLKTDPEAFCSQMNPDNEEARVTVWRWPRDLKREVMIPPGHFLLIRASVFFRAFLRIGKRNLYEQYALADGQGRYFALIMPQPTPNRHQRVTLRMRVYEETQCVRETASLLYLSEAANATIQKMFERRDLITRPFIFLATNGRGAMMRASTYTRRMRSRYDALLAGNPHPEMPVDRWIMFSRCRAWVVFQDYSQAIRNDCLQRFFFDYGNRARWEYQMPTGLGRNIRLSIEMEMVPGENRIRIRYSRHFRKTADQLEDERPIALIIRPDIENRSFHETTKAFAGPEHSWPKAVTSRRSGFTFAPDGIHSLEMVVPGADFVSEPEWKYMVYRPVEADRGLDPNSDLFSPGYFQASLSGGSVVQLEATMDGRVAENEPATPMMPALTEKDLPEAGVTEAMRRAMTHFVVDRQREKSVVAGYPWFLDWGRDSLIFCRGLIAAEAYDEVLSIVKLFGQFEQHGTLPNMIQGDDARNRDTSDAALWFMVVCRDLAAAAGKKVLEETCGGRTIREILFSIAASYISGTGNGIYMDADSGLIFSPAHFTWMDTNFPAGSPREGYPVEIQALWHAGLSFLAKLAPPENMKPSLRFDPAEVGRRVSRAIMDHYYHPGRGFLSDCLHCKPGQSPRDATADDALRPNQLFAITLDAVSDRGVGKSMLSACAELLVPGAIRSLADRPVDYPIEIRHNGQLLGDPRHPYRGRYTGDEDTSRKPAYHNGTAWTWVFPSFCEAWVKVYGEKSKPTALAWLGSSTALINEGCLGHMPEVLDGDHPHQQRGCDAQAWGASELYRVWEMMLMTR